jgi:hypothetical protein
MFLQIVFNGFCHPQGLHGKAVDLQEDAQLHKATGCATMIRNVLMLEPHSLLMISIPMADTWVTEWNTDKRCVIAALAMFVMMASVRRVYVIVEASTASPFWEHDDWYTELDPLWGFKTTLINLARYGLSSIPTTRRVISNMVTAVHLENPPLTFKSRPQYRMNSSNYPVLFHEWLTQQFTQSRTSESEPRPNLAPFVQLIGVPLPDIEVPGSLTDEETETIPGLRESPQPKRRRSENPSTPTDTVLDSFDFYSLGHDFLDIVNLHRTGEHDCMDTLDTVLDNLLASDTVHDTIPNNSIASSSREAPPAYERYVPRDHVPLASIFPNLGS